MATTKKTTKTSVKSKKAAPAKSKAKSKTTQKKKQQEPEVIEAPQLKLLRNDQYLAEYAPAIEGRHQYALDKINQLTRNGEITLSDFADGHLYFGLHRNADGTWVLREWAPNATAIYVIGDFTKWQERSKYAMKRIKNTDNWELKLPPTAMEHGQLYKLSVHWDGGQGNSRCSGRANQDFQCSGMES